MVRQFRLSLMSLLCAMCFTSVATAQLEMWLSSSSNAAAAKASIAPEISTTLGTPSEIYLWAKPEAGKTLENVSLNVVASNEVTLQFDGVEVQNGIGDESHFEFLFDSSSGLDVDDQVICLLDDTSIFDIEDDTTEAIWGFRGFTLSSDDAIGVSSDDGTGVHIATITVTGTALGEADLFLQIGQVGISQAGETSEGLEVQFGPGDGVLDAQNDRCQSSSSADISIEVVEELLGLLGDFNSNGELDANDIDLLSQQVRSGSADASFELDGNATIDNDDRVFWVDTLNGTVFGDADLNGTVDFTDFLALSSNFSGAGGWADGDFDGDQRVDFPDFLLLSNFFGFSTAGGEPIAVPEPVCSPIYLILSLVTLRQRRRSRFRRSS